MKAQKSTGFTDRYGEVIYEGDLLYNFAGEECVVTSTYMDDCGEWVQEDKPVLIDCVGDISPLDKWFLKGFAKNFNRITNEFC